MATLYSSNTYLGMLSVYIHTYTYIYTFIHTYIHLEHIHCSYFLLLCVPVHTLYIHIVYSFCVPSTYIYTFIHTYYMCTRYIHYTPSYTHLHDTYTPSSYIYTYIILIILYIHIIILCIPNSRVANHTHGNEECQKDLYFLLLHWSLEPVVASGMWMGLKKVLTSSKLLFCIPCCFVQLLQV